MTKWADYLISAVSYSKDNGKNHIEKLRVHKYLGENVGASQVWTRQQVIDEIDAGKSFMTIYKGDDGNWKKGAAVVKVKVGGKYYLRTDANSTAEDNLEELPEF